MNERAGLAIVLGFFFLINGSTQSSENAADGGLFRPDMDSVFNVSTWIMDETKESIFTIKLKCRSRTSDVVSCRLEDPQYQTTYQGSRCNRSRNLCNREHLRVDNSYIGRFEIKYRMSGVEKLIISSETSLKQLSFYRLMAGHLFPGVDVTGKPEGTYSLIEESVYGDCEAFVKIVRSRIKNQGPENERIAKLIPPPRENISETANNGSKTVREMLSIKRTRNLETCYPMPGLLIFDVFFYHPMMSSVHYDIKSSISRIIMMDRAFTSYTTEDIDMENTQKSGENSTRNMLHVRTTLTLHSIDPVEKPIPRIYDPISVGLAFVDGFNPDNRSRANPSINNKNLTANLSTTTPTPTSSSVISTATSTHPTDTKNNASTIVNSTSTGTPITPINTTITCTPNTTPTIAPTTTTATPTTPTNTNNLTSGATKLDTILAENVTVSASDVTKIDGTELGKNVTVSSSGTTVAQSAATDTENLDTLGNATKSPN